jgi:N4-gp56 family major capsid protein
MAANTKTTFADQYQKYFSKMLLQHAVQALVLAQFGVKAPIPKKSGSDTIRWFRYGVAKTDKIVTLTESAVIAESDYRVMEQSKVDATLVPYGQVIQLTDILQATEFFSSMEAATRTNAEDAALHADTVIRNELVTGTTKRFSYGTDFAGLLAGTTAQGKFVSQNLLDAATQLKLNRAPTINGSYVGVISPVVARDIMLDGAWVNAKTYSDVKDLYKGEVGSLYGVRIIEGTSPFIEDEVEGTYDVADHADNAGLIYSSFILGDQAFGVPELAGEGPMSPQVHIVNTADHADPLNQRTTVGFKTYWAAKVLNAAYFVVHRSKTAFA